MFTDAHSPHASAGPRERADGLLRALSEYLAADGLTLDENDAALLSLDTFLFAFVYSAENEELASCAYIAPLPEDGRKADAIREIMEGNYAWAGTGGGILGLDTESGHLCLSRRYEPGGLSPTQFIREVARQLTLCRYWRGRLAPEETVSPDAVRI